MQQLLPQWSSPMQLARRCATVSMLEGAIGPLSQAAEGLTLADPANTCPRTPPVATCMHELQQAMQDSLGCCQRRLYPCPLDTRRFPRRTARAVRAARYGDQPRFQAAGDGVPSMAYIRGGRAAQKLATTTATPYPAVPHRRPAHQPLVIRRGIVKIITHCVGVCHGTKLNVLPENCPADRLWQPNLVRDQIWLPYLVLPDRMWLPYSVPPCHIMSARGPNVASIFCPVGPYMAAIFGPGPNVAATFGPGPNVSN